MPCACEFVCMWAGARNCPCCRRRDRVRPLGGSSAAGLSPMALRSLLCAASPPLHASRLSSKAFPNCTALRIKPHFQPVSQPPMHLLHRAPPIPIIHPQPSPSMLSSFPLLGILFLSLPTERDPQWAHRAAVPQKSEQRLPVCLGAWGPAFLMLLCLPQILVKSMLRKRSFGNPFEPQARREERSMSAPGNLLL